MEGVKSSPNNPGRQAIPLSSPYLSRLPWSPYSVTFSVTPIVSLLSLLYLFRLSYFAVPAIDVESRRSDFYCQR